MRDEYDFGGAVKNPYKDASVNDSKTVPLSKQSKKKHKQYHAQQRGSWNGISPVTRIDPDKKKYSRERRKRLDRQSDADQ